MDPYIRGTIRLAKARGIFQRQHLSLVQEWGLKVSLVMEEESRNQQASVEAYNHLRGAITTFVPENPDTFTLKVKGLYPELFPEEEEATEIVVIEDVTEKELGDTRGEWDFARSETTTDEIGDVLAAMGQNVSIAWDEVQVGEVDEEGWI